MIRTMIFDLDGTLVQTERLKAISYARAAVELTDGATREEQVVEAFKDVVGHSRQEVASALMERFGLEEAARSLMPKLNVDAPWKAYVKVRLDIYEKMLADADLLRKNQWPYTVALAKMARGNFCRLALATMSSAAHARRVLEILGLEDLFDFVATADDIRNGKPDPEIYLLISREMRADPPDCLVIEDSPSGVKAARSAGMWCIAVSTPFTRDQLHSERLIDEQWIVDDHRKLLTTVRDMITARKTGDSAA